MPATAPRLMGCSTTSATTSSMPPTKGTSGELPTWGRGVPPSADSEVWCRLTCQGNSPLTLLRRYNKLEWWPGILCSTTLSLVFGRNRFPCVCKAIAARDVSHSWEQENPIARADLLLPAPTPLPGAASESPLVEKAINFSSCCCGDCFVRFHQANSSCPT